MADTTRRALIAGIAALPLLPGLARAETLGAITRLDPALDAILDAKTPIEVVADGIQWAEGPIWVRDGGYLLFSDPPANLAYRWKAGEGKRVFLNPSGLIGPIPATIREAGSNGMTLDREGRLLIADSGTRAIVRVDLKSRARTILADRFQGKRLNSCNDLVVAADGAIYFTDPPYGLTEGDSSPLKEQTVNGVYRLATDGAVTLVDGTLTRPNGIALSPDGGTLYVAVSDPEAPYLYAYTRDAAGGFGARKVLVDMRADVAKGLPGLPDGMKVAASGHLFASGPGGIHVLAPDGHRLGLISTGKAAANCAFGEDGRTLFITSSDKVCRVRMKISGW